ncbi:MAG: DUF2934 domain-containing protein [Gammaproteobacteria bacterium]|jgi:hypothetical protein|nr:DUF2934 domain-containing protein [Gammaproteobacteria bacterium]
MRTFNNRFDGTARLEPRRFARSAAEAAWLRASISGGPSTNRISGERDEQQIRELAYFKAERRGFNPGHELKDWLEAEREVGLA